MRIGIDIDDTIANTNDRIMVEALKYDKESVRGRGFKNKDGYSFMEMFYWTVCDVDKFMNVIRKGKFFSELEPVEDAVKYVNSLYDDGNEIIFITRRQNKLRTKAMTKKWLKNCGFKFHKVIFGGVKKGEICNELGIDLFVDNDEKNIYDVMDYGIKGILKGTKYNKDENELERIEDWENIYKFIKKVK